MLVEIIFKARPACWARFNIFRESSYIKYFSEEKLQYFSGVHLDKVFHKKSFNIFRGIRLVKVLLRRRALIFSGGSSSCESTSHKNNSIFSIIILPKSASHKESALIFFSTDDLIMLHENCSACCTAVKTIPLGKPFPHQSIELLHHRCLFIPSFLDL